MSVRSALYYRRGSGGKVAIEDMSVSTGQRFFVDSTNTSASDATTHGFTPDKPLATLDYAIGRCTASKGDIIYVMPGHAENLAAATSVNCDVAGVTIIGIGEGGLIPTFSTTAAAGSVTIGAANVTLKHLKFLANFATGTTTALTIAAGADGLTIDDCHFRDTSAANEFLIHLSVATTVDNLTVRNCSFITAAGTMSNSILFAGTTTNCLIEDNLFLVDSSDSVIDHFAAACTDACIRRNVVVNADTGAAGYCVQIHADGTGVAHDNRFGYNKVDAEISLGAKVWWFQNYASNTIAESGLLDPATTHAIP
jgi:hypothetical protein